jgi:hypothetical protein
MTMKRLMDSPLAIFKCNKIEGQDIWTLHPTHMECEINYFWITKKTETFPLSRLKPEYRVFTRISRGVFVGLAFLLIGAIGFAVSHYFSAPNLAEWIRARSVTNLEIGAIWTTVTMCLKERYIYIAGNPCIWIPYTWWDRRQVDRFAKRVVEQIRAEFSENQS